MKLYTVTIVETEEQLCVAARTANHATEVLVTFRFARTGSGPGRLEVGAVHPWLTAMTILMRLVADGEFAGVVIH